MSDKLVRIKNRYDTAENWETENPILATGELGIDSTNNIIKVGNGSSNWNDLGPVNPTGKIFEWEFASSGSSHPIWDHPSIPFAVGIFIHGFEPIFITKSSWSSYEVISFTDANQEYKTYKYGYFIMYGRTLYYSASESTTNPIYGKRVTICVWPLVYGNTTSNY